MNKLRTQAQARKLWLDFIAFKLELDRVKRPNAAITEMSDKICAMYRAISSEKYKTALKLGEEVLAVSIQYKARYEKDALQFLKLCNLAGEVVRGLKK
ncbi:hypothetical protein JA33_285 [Dickeya phage vB_DsoM_JA33]|uniref:Uncharacterized protein n=3 Tax=Salmondvirus JA11 TaxID=2734141 RepID=A0A384ZWQ3_9CAUD|nr:hypothetical protein HOU32_gp284 [Dickeya phage vB_DsoM_JA11]AXG66690.1 hypothetical protein JA13_287 [Dickeya phage vB_DsoM_JA13]AXG67659.1 hypothetical protein JA33_285 [Dickeya phage vB_DsoM_JA33]AYD80089.1 hypothetical protein JA11_284 [Dickeya phage vB_DsoM_JA11]